MRFAIRSFGVFAILAVLFTGVMGYEVSAAEDSNSMDVVMVIDVSGSMDETDPDGVAREAAKLFIDTMELKGSRVSVVSFSNQATVVPLTEINSATDKRMLKRQIDGVENGGATDIGLALTKAVEVLETADDVGNSQIILFLTDGRIDINSGNRNNAMSLADTNAAVDKAKSKYKIYAIGLNADGNVDKALLEDVANNTGARSYVVDEAKELPDIFNGIFADFIESNILDLGTFKLDGKESKEIAVTVPDTGVVEANFIMVSTDKIKNIDVVRPDGKTALLDESSIIWTQSDNYAVLKMVKPVPGQWVLRLSGEAGCEVQVKNVFNYNLTITTECVLDSRSAVLNVYAYIYDEDNNLITDGSVYNQFKATTYLKHESGTQIEIPMIVDGNRFLSENRESIAEGVYSVWAEMESDSVYRSSSESTVAIVFPEVKFKEGVLDELVLKGFMAPSSKTVNVTECIDSESLNRIAFYSENIMVVVSNQDVLLANLDMVEGQRDCKVTIEPKKDGETTVGVIFTNRYGEKSTKEILVKVDYVFYSIVPLVMIFLLMVAGGVAGFISYKKKAGRTTKWKGFFRCTVDDGREKKMTVCPLGGYEGELTLAQIFTDNDIKGEFVTDAANIKMSFDEKKDLINFINRSAFRIEHPIVNAAGRFMLGNTGRCIMVDAGYSITRKITIIYVLTEDTLV